MNEPVVDSQPLNVNQEEIVELRRRLKETHYRLCEANASCAEALSGPECQCHDLGEGEEDECEWCNEWASYDLDMQKALALTRPSDGWDNPPKASSQLPQVPKSACDGVPREIADGMLQALLHSNDMLRREMHDYEESEIEIHINDAVSSYRSWLEASRSQGEGK